ncbi:Bacteriophage holin of superfamily 6 (Holin_LLH), partial [Paenibacillus tianmuensis]
MDFQPFISDIALAVIGIASAAAITMFFKLKKNVIGWIDSKTTGQHREILHKVAEEAFAFAETSATGQKGAEKLNAAIEYANTHLGESGIQMNPAAVRGAIEKAYLAHKATTGQKAATEAPAEQPQPEHVQQLLAAVNAFSMVEK